MDINISWNLFLTLIIIHRLVNSHTHTRTHIHRIHLILIKYDSSTRTKLQYIDINVLKLTFHRDHSILSQKWKLKQ